MRGNQVEFRLWAPALNQVTLKLWRKGEDQPKEYAMRRLGSSDFGMPDIGEETDQDTWVLTTEAAPGDLYQYSFGGKSMPDPVSRLLPEGVHGRSEVVDPYGFQWTDENWKGISYEQWIIYELHIVTFTPGGTFDSAIEKLDYLKELGITAIEVMPVNATPGKRNWGYDGVSMYAVQENYGGPEAFRRFVNEAHARGLAVLLDVVYNHLGNEGNYLREFGPYFTEKHRTPWGEAINYDDEGCEGVRRYIVDNALYWLREYHLDGLRLDAVQTIKDDSEKHIVPEIAERAHELGQELGRAIVITAETDENDPKYVRPAAQGGYGAEGMWSDDFHHICHVMMTGESAGYYQDFQDRSLLAKALTDGYAFQGEHFNFWKENRGLPPEGTPLPANIICIQNHDQVGNRAKGERMTALMPMGARKMLAAILLLAPHTPLLFMGQEYDEAAPFQFFTDYGDPVLQKAVSEGRRNEFADFDFSEVPDPQDPQTFERSRLTWASGQQNQEMLEWHRSLIALRKELITPGPRTCRAEWIDAETLKMQIPADDPKVMLSAGVGCVPRWEPGAGWNLVLDSEADNYCVKIYRRT